MPRKLISGLFYSVDGVAGDPFRFQYDSFDDDLGMLMTETIERCDAAVMGRVTYQQWAEYWPNQAPTEDASFAAFINPVAKYVASRTLSADQLTWQNSQLINQDLLAFVEELKASEGNTISVQGSLSVVRQLVVAGLLDELILIVHPAIAGSGQRLFEGAEPTRLTLLDVKTTTAGNVVVTYGPKAS